MYVTRSTYTNDERSWFSKNNSLFAFVVNNTHTHTHERARAHTYKFLINWFLFIFFLKESSIRINYDIPIIFKKILNKLVVSKF